MDGLGGAGWFWFGAFVVALLVNGRAAFKLFVDWKGMLTTCRFVEDAYAGLDALPDEAALERAAAPVFLHLVPAWEEPTIAETLAALLASRYPHRRLHVVVATKASEEAAPHPAMTASTAELARRFRDGLPPWQQKTLSVVAMPGAGRKAHQLNWALRPETLGVTLGDTYDPRRVYVGVSDADSLPDGNVYRWIAAEVLAGRGAPAYQGVTLSLANFAAHDARGRVCAIQQSSIFIRVSIAPLPLLELVDLPETKDKMVRQNARWYKGVLDDVAFLWRAWRAAPTAFNAAQLCRHVGNKVLEWPIAAVVYPVLGFLGWHLAYRFAEHPVLFALGIAFPSISLGLTIWVGGIVTQDLIENLARYFPRAVDVRRTTLGQKFVGTFRCQTYWLLATRGAWRVLWALATTGRFDPAKTDRVTR